MHEDTRIILVWVVRIRNTLRTIRRSLCIMHQFCSKGLQMSERGIDVPSLYCERVFANVASDWDGRGALVGQRPAASRPEDCVGVCGCEKSPSPPPPSGSVSSFLYVKGGPDAHERERERERERGVNSPWVRLAVLLPHGRAHLVSRFAGLSLPYSGTPYPAPTRCRIRQGCLLR